MTLIRKTLTAAAVLLLALPAAAQDAPQRFRYLGQADQFAVMVTEASGPPSERMLTMIVAAGMQNGPGGANIYMISLRSDCTANTVQLMSAEGWSGEEKLDIHTGAADPHAPNPGTPYESSYVYACTGKAPSGPEIWIDGAAAARSYALERTRKAN